MLKMLLATTGLLLVTSPALATPAPPASTLKPEIKQGLLLKVRQGPMLRAQHALRHAMQSPRVSRQTIRLRNTRKDGSGAYCIWKGRRYSDGAVVTSKATNVDLTCTSSRHDSVWRQSGGKAHLPAAKPGWRGALCMEAGMAYSPGATIKDQDAAAVPSPHRGHYVASQVLMCQVEKGKGVWGPVRSPEPPQSN